VLHLINLTGEMTRPIRRIITLRDVRVTFEGFGQANKVFTLMRPRTLTPQKSGEGRWQVVVPSMDEYEVIVVER
jgi:hypothetical protein